MELVDEVDPLNRIEIVADLSKFAIYIMKQAETFYVGKQCYYWVSLPFEMFHNGGHFWCSH